MFANPYLPLITTLSFLSARACLRKGDALISRRDWIKSIELPLVSSELFHRKSERFGRAASKLGDVTERSTHFAVFFFFILIIPYSHECSQNCTKWTRRSEFTLHRPRAKIGGNCFVNYTYCLEKADNVTFGWMAESLRFTDPGPPLSPSWDVTCPGSWRGTVTAKQPAVYRE
jgi:hypothetical protein